MHNKHWNLGILATAFLVLALVSAPASAQSLHNLTGTWIGVYHYEDGRDGPFLLEISDHHGMISGHTVEPNTFGDDTSTRLFASIMGVRTNEQLTFVKVYDGTGGQTHTVAYAGRIALDRPDHIVGHWIVEVVDNPRAGTFDLYRLSGR